VTGIAERLRNELLEILGDDVLQAIRLLMDLIPGEAEFLMQIQLKQPVVADDHEGDALTGRGEGDAAVLAILDQRSLGRRQALQHTGH